LRGSNPPPLKTKFTLDKINQKYKFS